MIPCVHLRTFLEWKAVSPFWYNKERTVVFESSLTVFSHAASHCWLKEGVPMRRIPLLHSLWFAIPATVIVELSNQGLNTLTHSYWGDALSLVYFTGYGLYCLQNYIGCREYHCAITGPGFLLAAGVLLLRDIGLFDHGLGVPYLVFAAAALLGYLLEWQYWKRTGSHFRAARAEQQPH
jgi:hypothetical protein